MLNIELVMISVALLPSIYQREHVACVVDERDSKGTGRAIEDHERSIYVTKHVDCN